MESYGGEEGKGQEEGWMHWGSGRLYLVDSQEKVSGPPKRRLDLWPYLAGDGGQGIVGAVRVAETSFSIWTSQKEGQSTKQ